MTTFMTVEQLQAQIASLTAENERLSRFTAQGGNQMNRPNSQILIARKAVADVNRGGITGDDIRHRNFSDMIENGGYDDHHEMKVALRTIELAIEILDRMVP